PSSMSLTAASPTPFRAQLRYRPRRVLRSNPTRRSSDLLSPQLTSTDQKLALGFESLNDPRLNELAIPTVADWLPGDVTTTPPLVVEKLTRPLAKHDTIWSAVTLTRTTTAPASAPQ